MSPRTCPGSCRTSHPGHNRCPTSRWRCRRHCLRCKHRAGSSWWRAARRARRRRTRLAVERRRRYTPRPCSSFPRRDTCTPWGSRRHRRPCTCRAQYRDTPGAAHAARRRPPCTDRHCPPRHRPGTDPRRASRSTPCRRRSRSCRCSLPSSLAVVGFADADAARAVEVGLTVRVGGAGARASAALAHIRRTLRVGLVDADAGAVADLARDGAVRAGGGPTALAVRCLGALPGVPEQVA